MKSTVSKPVNLLVLLLVEKKRAHLFFPRVPLDVSNLHPKSRQALQKAKRFVFIRRYLKFVPLLTLYCRTFP